MSITIDKLVGWRKGGEKRQWSISQDVHGSFDLVLTDGSEHTLGRGNSMSAAWRDANNVIAKLESLRAKDEQQGLDFGGE